MTESIAVTPVLITFGGIFLIGLLADLLGRHTPLPRVTLLLLAGFAIGPSVLDWLPPFALSWFPLLTDVALAMIGFLLGGRLTWTSLRSLGRPVLAMSVGEVVVTAVCVFVLLRLVGVATVPALLLAGIAPATAPAAIIDVVNEYDARGRFTDVLLGIVAIDDAWGLVAFSLLLAAAQAVSGDAAVNAAIATGVHEIGGAVLLGAILGLPMAFLTGRVRPGEPTQAEALGLVLLCAGLAVYFGVSYILAAIVMGAVVANFATHHERPFHAIEGIEWPFLIVFFLLAGAALHVDALAAIGVIGLAYIVARTLGRIIGTRLSGALAGTERGMRNLMGFALLPQAGVAIGMALFACQRFPEHEPLILPTILASTVVFEVVGPVIARRVLVRAGDILPA